MEEFTISSFKYGLDTRRDILSSQPGTLVVLENGYINPGGEIEKRKNFALFATPGVNVTYGIEATEDGITVFGSDLPFGSSASQGQPIQAASVGTGLTYQQLKHPILANFPTAIYSAFVHKMSSVLYSESFNGKAFVSVRFADGTYALYFDGELIQHSVNGVVTVGNQSVDVFGYDLERQIEAVGWKATANVDEDGASELGSVIVESPQSDYFTPVPEWDSTSGQVGWKTIAQDGVPVVGTKAFASFQILVNSDTFSVVAPRDLNSVSPTIALCSPVAAQATAVLTAALIVRGINDMTSSTGYSALVSAAPATPGTLDCVTVYAPLGYDVTTAIVLTVTNSGAGTTGSSTGEPTTLSATIVPSPLEATVTIRQSGVIGGVSQVNIAASATITPSGGDPEYSYKWAETTLGSGNGIVIGNVVGPGGPGSGSISSDITPTATFIKTASTQSESTTVGNFRCTVTDASAVTLVKYLTVTLKLRFTTS